MEFKFSKINILTIFWSFIALSGVAFDEVVEHKSQSAEQKNHGEERHFFIEGGGNTEDIPDEDAQTGTNEQHPKFKTREASGRFFGGEVRHIIAFFHHGKTLATTNKKEEEAIDGGKNDCCDENWCNL